MESGANWLTVNTNSASANIQTYTFDVAENMTGKVRSTLVKVSWTDEKGEEFSEVVTVVQSATDGAELEALVNQVVLAALGESIDLTFETEDPLTATPSAAWITASIDNSVDPQIL
jgi:hypothetical protein